MLVSLVLGSERDRDIGDVIYNLLRKFGVDVEYRIISAHRNPKRLAEYVENCGAEVFIAVAGLSAALPGFIASHTLKPVIGVPKNVKLGGIDALLSIVQMPPGIPVACVGIDGGENAALLAVEVLSLKYPELREKLMEYRKRKAEGSLKVIK